MVDEYTITRVNAAPNWAAIPMLNVDHYQWLPALPVTMQAQICYSESGLHVHLQCIEPHIRAEHNTPLAEVCEDSCMEFFFRPMEEDLRYFNIEINPNGCTYVGFGSGMENHVRLIPKDGELTGKRVRYTQDGWEVFYTVPLPFVRIFFPDFELTAGKRIYANCYKCGDKTVQPHYMTWNPIDSADPDFHRPTDFGLMILG